MLFTSKINHFLTNKYFSSKLILKNVKMSSLSNIVRELDLFAPIKYAEKWDNVGLLIEPSTPKDIKTILLTNDLTELVLKEALANNTDLIISYHPPIFAPLKRITQQNWKERIVSVLIENRIALYSPHTSWDVAKSGVNDWLASFFVHKGSIPIQPIPNCPLIGIGRKINLRENITIRKAVELIKEKTNLNHVHLALAVNCNMDSPVESIAICAGSGGSVLKDIPVNLYLTGEMSHHEILQANHSKTSVITLNHSNSERGYLVIFKNILEQLIGNSIKVIVSEADADPIKTY